MVKCLSAHNKAPHVSVITPSYNSIRFIGETIVSVQNQSYENWEMIIVDDASTDESVTKIKEIIEGDSRIRLVSLKENIGAAKARNIAIQEARGRYIAFLDSDDIWLPHKLKTQLLFMEEMNVSFSYASYSLIDENGNELNRKVNVPKSVDYHCLAGNTIIGCLTVIIDRERIPYIEMPSVQPEDTALWLKLLHEGHEAKGIQQVLARYRIVANSVSRNKIKAAFRYWKLLRDQKCLNAVQIFYYFSKYAYHAYRKNKINVVGKTQL
ncbi:glycosyltransferase family 2 protein [Bacillus cereus]|uniref:glycosyltransferase family 2 protein n=1 Tax=Bacillus cereus group TaxID=86661 RepID=UPI0018663C0C|nr:MULTISPECIES: glycosyltransferase family 2 protein [Bacillus cereus group]UBR32996.1 glycosyltransferase [Bacillus sp. SD-4]MBE3644431.1 glycosyltransferase family 2 protein [Bacillus anthracis]MDA2122708.1 glycosyltransferase family 2 protein [Bacillus cereus]MDD0818720.1 glycosyltransferase family 2 protein [Bacillus cereus]QUW33168.1 glycosyltransferase family 2 protein [Bacillus cereus]